MSRVALELEGEAIISRSPRKEGVARPGRQAVPAGRNLLPVRTRTASEGPALPGLAFQYLGSLMTPSCMGDN